MNGGRHASVRVIVSSPASVACAYGMKSGRHEAFLSLGCALIYWRVGTVVDPEDRTGTIAADLRTTLDLSNEFGSLPCLGRERGQRL